MVAVGEAWCWALCNAHAGDVDTTPTYLYRAPPSSGHRANESQAGRDSQHTALHTAHAQNTLFNKWMEEDWTGTISKPLIILSVILWVVSELSTSLSTQYPEPDTFKSETGKLHDEVKSGCHTLLMQPENRFQEETRSLPPFKNRSVLMLSAHSDFC